MFDWLSALIPYTPFFIFVAAFFDVFAFTGLFLYGGTLLVAIAGLHASGVITAPEIALAAIAGTLLGSGTNFFIGRRSSHLPFVQKLLQKRIIKRLDDLANKQHLLVFIIVGRFITLARPLYSLFLGTLEVSPRRFFLYEIPVVIVWVLLWLFILLQGETFVTKYVF
ncbi:MAG: VTT domain-containing protein [Patescibacteria group bacterium]